MKETIREWKKRTNINIKYIDGEGRSGVFTISQQKLLEHILRIVQDYKEQGLKLTNRQLFYQLVSEAIIPNAEATYKRICTFLTDARYAGLIDWDAIEDRGRQASRHAEWDSIKDLIQSAVYSYRLPRWKDQEYYVELYTEKQAMESVLKPIADRYHLYFGANKGYSSASSMYDLAQRLREKLSEGKKCVVLYLGDHDSSGLDMVRDIKERLVEFITQGENKVYISESENDITDVELDESLIDEYLIVEQLALKMEQVRKFNPPPNPAKMTDPRAQKYIQEFGNHSWELDALKPDILMDIAEKGVQKYMDWDKYESWIELEKKQKEKLERYGKTLAKDEVEE